MKSHTRESGNKAGEEFLGKLYKDVRGDHSAVWGAWHKHWHRQNERRTRCAGNNDFTTECPTAGSIDANI